MREPLLATLRLGNEMESIETLFLVHETVGEGAPEAVQFRVADCPENRVSVPTG